MCLVLLVCEQGQETLEPQQHSEHSWFWEIQQWPHYYTVCYWHLEHPGMPSAISSVNVRSPTHIWIRPFNRLSFCHFFFGNSWIQLSDQCASYSLQLISSLMALALFNLVFTWPISAWLTFHNMECKLWLKTEMHWFHPHGSKPSTTTYLTTFDGALYNLVYLFVFIKGLLLSVKA